MNILILCSGHYARSPLAEVILRDVLTRHFGSNTRHHVTSAGLLDWFDGWPINPMVLMAIGWMEIHDLPAYPHQVTEQELAQADVILCMERKHISQLWVDYPEHANKADLVMSLIGGCGDVPDPYPGLKATDERPDDVRAYVAVGHLLQECFEGGLETLLKMGGNNERAKSL